jgi:hypothetical protein
MLTATLKRFLRRYPKTYTALRSVRAGLKNSGLYDRQRARQAERQDRHYLQLREDYHKRQKDVFGPPGYLARSKSLFAARGVACRTAKADPKDAHIFVIDNNAVLGVKYLKEFARSFDVAMFSLAAHQTAFLQGRQPTTEELGSLETWPNGFLRNTMLYDEWSSRLQVDLIAAVKQAHAQKPLDLVWAYVMPFEWDARTYRAIHDLGIPVAIWSLDDKHVFVDDRRWPYPHDQKELIGLCDIHLTSSLECVRWYLAEGAPAYYFPEAVDLELYLPAEGRPDFPVSFVGQAYGWRIKLIRELKWAGIPIACFGPGWENGFVQNELDIFRRSAINLGIGGVMASERVTCIKGRDFEMAALGRLYMTTFDYELARHFHVGREIICYRNEIDCVELLRYYLERPDEARQIAQAARQRCAKDHSWTARMKGLLRWAGILDEPHDSEGEYLP